MPQAQIKQSMQAPRKVSGRVNVRMNQIARNNGQPKPQPKPVKKA